MVEKYEEIMDALKKSFMRKGFVSAIPKSLRPQGQTSQRVVNLECYPTCASINLVSLTEDDGPYVLVKSRIPLKGRKQRWASQELPEKVDNEFRSGLFVNKLGLPFPQYIGMQSYDLSVDGVLYKTYNLIMEFIHGLTHDLCFAAANEDIREKQEKLNTDKFLNGGQIKEYSSLISKLNGYKRELVSSGLETISEIDVVAGYYQRTEGTGFEVYTPGNAYEHERERLRRHFKMFVRWSKIEKGEWKKEENHEEELERFADEFEQYFDILITPLLNSNRWHFAQGDERLNHMVSHKNEKGEKRTYLFDLSDSRLISPEVAKAKVFSHPLVDFDYDTTQNAYEKSLCKRKEILKEFRKEHSDVDKVLPCTDENIRDFNIAAMLAEAIVYLGIKSRYDLEEKTAYEHLLNKSFPFTDPCGLYPYPREKSISYKDFDIRACLPNMFIRLDERLNRLLDSSRGFELDEPTGKKLEKYRKFCGKFILT